MTTSHDMLQQGIAAARSGQRALARQLFVCVIQADQYNDDAWVWLAGVVDDPADMRRCLQQALRINPLNPQARQGIAWLDQRARQAAQSAAASGKPGEAQAAQNATPATQVAVAHTSPAPEQAEAVNDAAGEKQPSAPDAPTTAVTSPSESETSTKAGTARRSFWFGVSKPAAARPSEPVSRRFGFFRKAQAPAAAPEADAVRPSEPVSRRFGFFRKAEAPAAAPEADAARPSEPVSRRFGLFRKPQPPATAMVATAAAGAAGATMTAPVAVPAPKSRRKEKELPLEEGDSIRDRCPYCGELNKPDRAWCRRCDRSLMIRGPAREQRSPWLSILGMLWVIGGVLGILAAVLGLIGFLVMYSSSGGDLSRFPLIIVLIVVIVAMVYGGQIALARAMLNRARWAYWIIAALTTLQLGGSLLGALGAAATIRDTIAQAQALLPSSEAAAVADAIIGAFGTVVLIDTGIKAFFMLLVALSWRDFYGPKERFVSEVRGATDYELFNTGLALQRKGMWWMAMKQWEAAVANSPRDIDYLQALTVAYAKLGEWEKARETIAKAIKVAPDNPALKQIQDRIERAVAAQG